VGRRIPCRLPRPLNRLPLHVELDASREIDAILEAVSSS
jgi:hypothetical protein